MQFANNPTDPASMFVTVAPWIPHEGACVWYPIPSIIIIT
jgi:hypothetical protein